MNSSLDDIFWQTLSGPHARYAVGTDTARRYTRSFSPIVGFADLEQPDFAALVPWCDPDEHFYCDRWAGAVPDGWRIDAESTMFKMVWNAPMPSSDDAPDAVPLGSAHASQALELATLTNPGPFGSRTIELGDYFGVFDGTRLIAMAGERMFACGFREISGVCTHPDFQGRGLARRLVAKLVRREMQRGETPFLHVTSTNHGARRLYSDMGFRDYRETVVRVVSRCP